MRPITTAAVILPFALLLAACGGGGAGGNGSSETEPTAAEGQTQPENLMDDQQNTLIPVTTPSPSPMAGLPAGFQGRWGMTVADCEPGRADAKGLLTIAGDKLSFYESRGTATGIKAVAATTVTFTLPVSGEGQTWNEPTTLTLLDDGKTLQRQVAQPAGSFRYSRCPS